jgi:sialate O-acetylesterase
MMRSTRKAPAELVAVSLCVTALLLVVPAAVVGDVRLPSIFGDHMVLQQGKPISIWGWANQGEKVTVTIGGQSQSAFAGNDGKWIVELNAMPAGGPHRLTVKADRTITLRDVLVGEVWVCSGQSNMALLVGEAKDSDLETKTAKYPNIRLITLPQIGPQGPQEDFEGEWRVCSPETVATFSAVAYFFGRQLHQTLGAPIGLIANAVGASGAEAWVRRDLLEADQRYRPLLQRYAEFERAYDEEKIRALQEEELKRWKDAVKKARAAGRQPPQRPWLGLPRLVNRILPGNAYDSMLKPIIGYSIRGVIWYQGEANAKRAYQYRHLFPLVIQSWRNGWGQGDFPFYWVQLPAHGAKHSEPRESQWAELREAQALTTKKLPNTGQAVTIDLDEANTLHPKNKQDVAKRLARWALARDYRLDLVHRSPIYKSMEKKGGKLVVTFEHVGGGLITSSVKPPIGFAVSGKEQKFVWAQARIIGEDKVEVWADQVPDPVAVRYAWADNPMCNLENREGLPVTPFRTDDWPGVTINNQAF